MLWVKSKRQREEEDAINMPSPPPKKRIFSAQSPFRFKSPNYNPIMTPARDRHGGSFHVLGNNLEPDILTPQPFGTSLLTLTSPNSNNLSLFADLGNLPGGHTSFDDGCLLNIATADSFDQQQQQQTPRSISISESIHNNNNSLTNSLTKGSSNTAVPHPGAVFTASRRGGLQQRNMKKKLHKAAPPPSPFSDFVSKKFSPGDRDRDHHPHSNSLQSSPFMMHDSNSNSFTPREFRFDSPMTKSTCLIFGSEGMSDALRGINSRLKSSPIATRKKQGIATTPKNQVNVNVMNPFLPLRDPPSAVKAKKKSAVKTEMMNGNTIHIPAATLTTPTSVQRLKGKPPIVPKSSSKNVPTRMNVSSSSSSAPRPPPQILNTATAVATPIAKLKKLPSVAIATPQNKENLSKNGNASQSATKRRPNTCNCKRSQCLKLYCDCFAMLRFCNGCNCTDCKNTPDAVRFFTGY